MREGEEDRGDSSSDGEVVDLTDHPATAAHASANTTAAHASANTTAAHTSANTTAHTATANTTARTASAHKTAHTASADTTAASTDTEYDDDVGVADLTTTTSSLPATA